MKKRLMAVLSMLLFFATVKPAIAAISITSPEFGVAQELTFDLELNTDSSVSCRFSTTFAKPFNEMDEVTTTGNTLHTIEGITLPAFGTEYNYFINCSSGTEASDIKLKADNTEPSILNAVAEPEKVLQSPLETTLSVKTGENTSCKYDQTFEEYDSMANFFIGSDSDKNNYKNSHEKPLTRLSDNTDYTFNVMCRDLSGRKTTLAKISFKVNTSTEPEIIDFTPKDGSYKGEENVVISITTNKNSICKYGSESPPTRESGNFNVQGTLHETTLQLDEGSHTYYFKCVFEGPKERTAQTTFTIDKTKPAVLLVDDDQKLDDAPDGYTYYTNRLKARWEAKDNESGIKDYNYSIISGSMTVVNWSTTTSDEVTARDLELQDGREYVFRVKARNNAGLWSETKESDGVRVDISLNAEQACKNEVKDGDETDVDCGGSCARKCLLKESCEITDDCSSGYCSEGKCAKGSCDDGVKNQDETDVDCGGSCEACLEGDKCKESIDCESGICAEDICISKGPCYNGVLDPKETDVDCGGVCAELKSIKCQLGKKCSGDEDCRSRTCGIDGKCAAMNDGDYDSVVDDKDNCQRAYNPKQEDTDKDGFGDSCDDDSDNDGMADEWEKSYGLNFMSPGDALLDNDGDTLSNLKESHLKTNPLMADSDRDGYDDAEEVEKGTDPNDAGSKLKKSRLLTFFAWMLLFLAIFAAIAYFYYRKLTGPVLETKREQERRASHYEPPRAVQEPKQERKYRPEPIYRPTPPERRHTTGDLDEIRRHHSSLSGEEVFERLKRHTRRRRH
ncbi:fibronectin type III domain-containing protein [Candidatus Woesearchaeota archaeon]|nr:fibronectin type III domain-containing protein [Candidatus Woesearchaeota archaeon]